MPRLRHVTRSACLEVALRECLAHGMVEARVRPDGRIGYYLTPAGKALAEEDP